VLPRSSPVALLGLPRHDNVGDSAIWQAERRYLRGTGCPLVYLCSARAYSASRLRRRLGRGVILLSGGGNLGDVWLDEQAFREQVIQDFPTNPVIQLPQSIFFQDRDRLENARRVLNSHKQLTLMVRDARSLMRAQEYFSAATELCPDVVFTLGPLPRVGTPSTEILWLLRSDLESAGSRPPGGRSRTRTDWNEGLSNLTPDLGDLAQRLAHTLLPYTWIRDRVARMPGSDALAERFARARVSRGRRILSQGRVVITDRLHAHILCLLMGIPHVILDTAQGKLADFHATWTSGSPITRFATSDEDAEAKAHVLLRHTSTG